MLGRGDYYGVDFFKFEEFFGDEHGFRGGAVGFLVEGDGALAVFGPEVADGDHLHVFRFAELSDHAVELGAAVADADMADGDAIVGASDSAVGKCARACSGGCSRKDGALLNEFAASDFSF